MATMPPPTRTATAMDTSGNSSLAKYYSAKIVELREVSTLVVVAVVARFLCFAIIVYANQSLSLKYTDSLTVPTNNTYIVAFTYCKNIAADGPRTPIGSPTTQSSEKRAKRQSPHAPRGTLPPPRTGIVRW